MIGEVFLYLKDQLNEYMNSHSSWNPLDATEEIVVLPDATSLDPIVFKLGAVSIFMMGLEEETTLRAADPYRRLLPDGTALAVMPEVRMNLYVLFVAHFSQYDQSLDYLTLVVRYFQNHRILDHQNAPGLADDVDKLIFELVTLPFGEQDSVWNALRATYHPSILYRMKMITLRDEDGMAPSELGDKTILAEAI